MCKDFYFQDSSEAFVYIIIDAFLFELLPIGAADLLHSYRDSIS